MGVHDSGSGSNWREDSPDIDQPQGLDYREFNGLKAAIRKRVEKGHADFGDSTAGGQHIPGCGVLNIDYTSDPTAKVVADGTMLGHGIVWSCDGSGGVKGCLFCSTEASDLTNSGTWREVLLHPDQIWGGKDITWTGKHQFDASVEMTVLSVYEDFSVLGHLYCGSNAEITGSLWLDSSSDFSSAYFAGDVSFHTDIFVDGTAVLQNTDISGSLDVSGDLNVSGAVSIMTAPKRTDSDGNDLLNAHTYQASTDMFVMAYTEISLTGSFQAFVSDATADITSTTKLVCREGEQASYNTNKRSMTFCCPKDYYWEIDMTRMAPFGVDDLAAITVVALGDGSVEDKD